SWKYLCTPRWEDQALVLASRDSDGPQHGGRLNFSPSPPSVSSLECGDFVDLSVCVCVLFLLELVWGLLVMVEVVEQLAACGCGCVCVCGGGCVCVCVCVCE